MMAGRLWCWIPLFSIHKEAVNLQTRVQSLVHTSTSSLRMSDPRARLYVSLPILTTLVRLIFAFSLSNFYQFVCVKVHHYGRFLNSQDEIIEKGAQVFLSVDQDRRRLNSRYENRILDAISKLAAYSFNILDVHDL